MDRARTGPQARAPHERNRAAGELRTPGPRPSTMTIRQPDGMSPLAPYPGLMRYLLRDRLLLIAFAICTLLIAYQIVITLLQPSWIGPATDWLRAALAWPELVIVAGVSLWLTRTRHPAARSWWMWSAALLSYATARTLWSVSDQLIFHHGVPFPTFPDLFFVLQYPFFFLAVILLPRTRFWGSRLILTLDGVLVMGAVAALSWHFMLAPLYAESGISLPARAVSLAYPVGDLFVLFALTVTLLRPGRYAADRLVLVILVLAVMCLIVADTWVGWLLLSPPHRYTTGSVPDVFWIACYLLIPLASLCQFRLAQQLPSRNNGLAVKFPDQRRPQWYDFTASIRLFFPVVIALIASGVIIMHSTMLVTRVGWRQEIASFAVSTCLLLLVLIRQQLTFLEIAQLRREAEYARASEQAATDLNRRKDEFLSFISHELKTPLTSLQGYLELLALRSASWRTTEEEEGESARNGALAKTTIAYAEESSRRIAALVNELLDDAQIRDGRLALYVEPVELGIIVQKAVAEQRVLAPGRTIRMVVPSSTRVPVEADSRRIEQVVTNFLTNALKYSKEHCPVEVRLEVTGDVARVSVRDEGIGVPPAEQAHLWERLHPIEGNTVQTGSGVSLGIGLHISKSIIEGHHGQVGLDSTRGMGSIFWFTLPLAPPPA
jgi:signal transduction histidine kinase